MVDEDSTNNEKTSHPRGWNIETLKKMDVRVWSYLEDFEDNRYEYLSAIEDVLRSGNLILGPHVKKLEDDFSSYCEVSHGVGVGSCTDAIILGLRAMDIGTGDEVITVANTAVPTVAAIAATGATAKFVDIDPESYLMDVTKLRSAITKKTKCILPVHIFGQCVDMDEINKVAEEFGLKVLEDCAQAHGALYKNRKAGSMSDVGTFSFYPTKVLGGFGDGGMVVTKNLELYERVKGLRVYGMRDKYFSVEKGVNSRLDELHAAIILKKFVKLDEYIEKRNALAKRYDELLIGTSLVLPKIADFNDLHVYYVYVVRHPKRDLIMQKLKDRGIFVNVSYEWPVHTMDAFADSGYKEGDLPETEAACREIFSLPMYPELTFEKQDKVVEALKEILIEID
jgi:aminotransferase EvaB